MRGRVSVSRGCVDPGLRPPGVRIAALLLWPGCDMRCRFCASEREFTTMDFPWAANLLEGLAARGYRNVVLGGGEPALWPHDLPGLARRARELGFLVQLNTNGVRAPRGFPRVGGVDRVILPLEAAEPARHDALRRWGGGSHHARVEARLRSLARAGVELTISTVLTRANADGVPALARRLARLRDVGARLHAWHLYRFLPVGRGGRVHARELALSGERFRSACAAAKESGLGFPVYRRSHMLRSSTVEFFWREGDALVRGRDVRARTCIPAGVLAPFPGRVSNAPPCASAGRGAGA